MSEPALGPYQIDLTRHTNLKPPAPKQEPEPPRFNWPAFFTMVTAIVLINILGFFIPGRFDEAVGDITVAAIYGFLAAKSPPH